jgi:hypothetical protein
MIKRNIKKHLLPLIIIAVFILLSADVSFAQEFFLAKSGKAQAVIVIGREADTFSHWVAGELKQYLQKLSGAQFHVVTSDKVPLEKTLILVGGPKDNPFVASAQQKQLVNFDNLKPEGIILKRIDLDGTPAMIVGSNDEAGTMYAAYELLERLGIVFQLNNDIIPKKKSDLTLSALDVRLEPQLKYRGVHCCHALRWYMGLEDFRKHLDQLAKMKMNCLQFFIGISGSPWLEFSYKEKKTQVFYPKESGYLTWGGPLRLKLSGTAKDVRVARECFPSEYIGAPEFANVETQEEAYRTARKFLREVIQYAHSRKIQVWLMIGEVPRVPPNMVPPDVNTPTDLAYSGRLMPHGHPDLAPIWEAAVTSLIKNYPETDAFGIWGSEHCASPDDPETQRMIAQYSKARKMIPSFDEIVKGGNTIIIARQQNLGEKGSALDVDFAELCVINKVVRNIKKRNPDVNLVVSTLFRGYLLRAMDALFPKDVRLQNMDTFGNNKSVMHFYDGIEDRELIVMPRIDHDGCELQMQLNLIQYEEDEIISGAAKYGLSGIVGQLNKERGLEINTRYVAEGAWDPTITVQDFYKSYLSRVFGSKTAESLSEAYLLLDRELGWASEFTIINNRINKGIHHKIFKGYRYFHLFPLAQKSRQPLKDAEKIQSNSLLLKKKAEKGYRALKMIRPMLEEVPPGSREELQYVIYKVENFNTYMEVVALLAKAKATILHAYAVQKEGDIDAYKQQLQACKKIHDQADELARTCAQQMIPYCNDPTERYLLFRYNQNVIGSIEEDRAYLDQLLLKINK